MNYIRVFQGAHVSRPHAIPTTRHSPPSHLPAPFATSTSTEIGKRNACQRHRIGCAWNKLSATCQTATVTLVRSFPNQIKGFPETQLYFNPVLEQMEQAYVLVFAQRHFANLITSILSIYLSVN